MAKPKVIGSKARKGPPPKEMINRLDPDLAQRKKLK
jgi:hypothetical protein